MSLKTLKQEELEQLSYTDLSELILKDSKKPMNTAAIFKEISKIVGLSDEEYTSKIGDFYTSLTTDKRFIFLENDAEWDLRSNHTAQKIVIDDDDDEDIDEEEEEDEDIDEEDEDIDTMENDDDDDTLDDDDDDISDLAIISEDDLEEN
jgi:DNA-directed RNA polymerase subunit delta